MKPEAKFKYGLADIHSSDEIEALVAAFSALGGERVDSPDWDLLWYLNHEPPVELYKNISGTRRVNHIPGIEVITDKWNLYNSLKQHWKIKGFDKQTDIPRFFPVSWKLPEDKHAVRQRLQEQPDRPLILKLMNMANGAGIKLIHDENELPTRGHWIVQEYIDDPHLINDRKYILQVFLLITGCDPLTAYLYQDGVADLAVLPYSNDPDQWSNPAIHIATTLLQSRQQGFDLDQHCLPLEKWRQRMTDAANAQATWIKIESLLKETLHAAESRLRTTANTLLSHPEQCFELLAIDIMLNRAHKPWLIECNRSAGMQAQYSHNLKPALMKDTLTLILNRRQTLLNITEVQANPQPETEFARFRRLI